MTPTDLLPLGFQLYSSDPARLEESYSYHGPEPLSVLTVRFRDGVVVGWSENGRTIAPAFWPRDVEAVKRVQKVMVGP